MTTDRVAERPAVATGRVAGAAAVTSHPAILLTIAEAAEALATACRKAVETSGSSLADSPVPEQLSTPMAPLLRPKDVAARLGINPRTLRRLIHLGQVPTPILIGGAKRWDPDEFDAWLAGRTSGRVSRARAGRRGGRP